MSDSQKKQFNGDPGETVLLDDMYQEREHLYVVVTRPEGDPPKVVMVNLTSRKSHKDRTVVLNKGDHPFIEHDTVVNYKAARPFDVQALKKQVDNKTVRTHRPFERDILRRIQNGVLQSPWTPRKIKKYCADRL